MEFTASMDNDGNISVKPIIEKKGKDLIIHMPSLPLIHKLKMEKEKENGKRDI
jgi:hypothetical protein